MDAPNAEETLLGLFRGRGINQLFELRELDDGFEVAPELVNFFYDGAEGFWVTRELDWMVYASHENSITFGGQWLIGAMKSALPDFEKYRYKGWDLKMY